MAASSEPLMTSTLTPVSFLISDIRALELEASRIAEVAQQRYSTTPYSSIICRQALMKATVFRRFPLPILPFMNTSSPRRRG